MKKSILSVFFLAVLFSCRKEVSRISGEDNIVLTVKKYLKDSLSAADFALLDFGKVIVADHANEISTVRIGFMNKKLFENFVALTVKNECVEKAKIVSLSGMTLSRDSDTTQRHTVNGEITIETLNRKFVQHSEIRKGYVSLFQKKETGDTKLLTTAPSQPSPPQTPVYQPLPEVVVIAYIPSSGSGVSWSTWINLISLVNGGNGINSVSSFYDSSDPFGWINGGGVAGGGSGSSSGNGGGASNVIEIEAEYIYGLTGVSLPKMFKCFDNVPSGGATYSVKLCSDIPANSNPGASTNFSNVSGGHTFLTVTKTNGNLSVTQSFGFYPQQSPSIWNPFSSITSEIKDNGVQEINASIEMVISESQFNAIKQNALSWAVNGYKLADYNCTNYAVDIFNSVRSSPLIIPSYEIFLPGNANQWAPSDPISVIIKKSPQMLFRKLQEMKNANGVEAANIRIDQSHNYRAPVSNGECN